MPASTSHLAELSTMSSSVMAVLAKWADELYYRVDVLKCDAKSKKCLVKFEDDLECWMKNSDLHLQLDIDKLPDNKIICCVCDLKESEQPNEIIMCDTCQQGYHVNCHYPIVNRDAINLNDDMIEWQCATCSKVLGVAEPKADRSVKSVVKKSSTDSPAKKKRKSSHGSAIKKRPPKARSDDTETKTKDKVPKADNDSMSKRGNKADPDIDQKMMIVKTEIEELPTDEKGPDVGLDLTLEMSNQLNSDLMDTKDLVNVICDKVSAEVNKEVKKVVSKSNKTSRKAHKKTAAAY